MLRGRSLQGPIRVGVRSVHRLEELFPLDRLYRLIECQIGVDSAPPARAPHLCQVEAASYRVRESRRAHDEVLFARGVCAWVSTGGTPVEALPQPFRGEPDDVVVVVR